MFFFLFFLFFFLQNWPWASDDLPYSWFTIYDDSFFVFWKLKLVKESLESILSIFLLVMLLGHFLPLHFKNLLKPFFISLSLLWMLFLHFLNLLLMLKLRLKELILMLPFQFFNFSLKIFLRYLHYNSFLPNELSWLGQLFLPLYLLLQHLLHHLAQLLDVDLKWWMYQFSPFLQRA